MGSKRRRDRGDGTVFWSEADGCWVARVSLGVVGGKRVRHKARAATEREAQAELVKLRRAYSQGASPVTMTLDAYLAEWLEAKRPTVSPSTHTSYAGHVRLHIAPLLGGIRVARLQTADARRLIADRLAAGLSPATVSRILTTLHVALQVLVDERSLPSNPAGVALPVSDPEPVHPMTVAEANAVIGATRETWLGPLVRLLLGSGLRLGEACALNQGDVGDGFVRLRKSKTTTRAVPVSQDGMEALAEALRACPRRGPKEPLFWSPRGQDRGRGQRGRLSGQSATHALPRILGAAGLPALTPHKLRHGHATMLLSAGVPMRVISEQLGHANPAMTAKVYAHVVPESQAKAVRRLDAVGSRNGSRLGSR